MAFSGDGPSLFSPLPAVVEDDAKHFMTNTCKTESEWEGQTQVEEFLKKHLPNDKKKQGEFETFKYKFFHLDNKKSRKKSYDRKRPVRHKLTSKEKRKLGLFKLPKQQSFDSFIPLHNLWRDYMNEVIDFSKVTEENKASTAQQKLLKADYHGALVTVTKSKTPSLIGQTGIIIQETKNVFKIVTKDDKLKMIPKENSVFTMEHEGFVFNIQGSQFRYTAAERIHRKFKFRPRLPNDL